jgi:superfamily II DNA or RNA helicase
MNTIEIQFSPIKCKILTPLSIDMSNLLHAELSYQMEGFFFSPKYQSHVWDGYTRLYNKKSQSFKTGLLYRVTDLLTKEGYDVHVKDLHETTSFNQRNFSYELRRYQLEAVNDLLKFRFGVLQSPPRSGKTMIILATIDSDRQLPAIILSRSLDLAYQTRDKASEALQDLKIGIVGDGKCEIGDVTIVTVQSAYSAYGQKYKLEKGEKKEKPLDEDKESVKELLYNTKTVFYDEAHESDGRTSRVILDKCSNVTMRIGVSATPFEGEEQDLRVEEAVGPVIHKISYSELIKEGYLLAPLIYMYKLPKIVVEGNYQSIYKQAVTNNEFLTSLIKKIVDKLVSQNYSVVVQTEFREHSKRLAQILECPCLIGNEPAEKRKDVLDKIRNREYLCVVSTLIEQGIDLPSLNFTINLAGGKKKIPTIQRMRSLTPYEGKKVCGVVDFIHQCKYLKKHSNLRKTFYQSESEFTLLEKDVSKKSLEEIT